MSSSIYSLKMTRRSGVSRYSTAANRADIGTLHFCPFDLPDAVRINALTLGKERINALILDEVLLNRHRDSRRWTMASKKVHHMPAKAPEKRQNRR